MNDYHEFKRTHEIQIKECQLYQSSNYASVTRGIVAPSGATTILSISSTSGSKSANGSGATKSGGPITCGGLGASINTQGPLLALNPIVEFFHEL